MDTLFAIGVGAYAATTAGHLAALWKSHPQITRAAHVMLAITLVYWAGVLGYWVSEAGLAGSTRLWLGLSAWSLGALYLLLLRRYTIDSLGAFVTALGTVLAVFALIVARKHGAEVPGELAQVMLTIHIVMAFIGITAFAFASAVSVVYLLQSRMLKRKRRPELGGKMPSLDVLDHLSLRGILVGFPFYTVALLIGSAQALRMEAGFQLRWAYVLASISWFIYGGVLQARLMAGWRGRRAAVLTVAGLVLTLVVVGYYVAGLR